MSAAKKATAVLIIILLVVVALPFWGFVLYAYWGWFISPALNIPEITYPSAIGLWFSQSLLTHPIRHRQKKEKTEDPAVDLINEATLIPALFLLFGFAIHTLIQAFS